MTVGIHNHILSQQTFLHQASLAQLVERGTSNAEVTGSTPLGGIFSFCFGWDSVVEDGVLAVEECYFMWLETGK
jgi:hypothetical protein